MNREVSKVLVLHHSAINKSSILSGAIPAGLEWNTSMTTAPDCLAINKGICSASMPGENLASNCAINNREDLDTRKDKEMERKNVNREDSKVVVLHHCTINKSSILSGAIPAGLEWNTSRTTAPYSLTISGSTNRSGVCWASKDCEIHKKCKEVGGEYVNREDGKVLVLHRFVINKSS